MQKYNISSLKNKILIGDCLQELKKIPSNSIDLIFADPPYFMQIEKKLKRFDGSEYKGVNDSWDKFDSYKEYDNFSKKWLSECKRILKENGSIWVIGTFHNIFRLGYLLQNLNFWIINDVTWSKRNPTPNFLGTKFVNSHENLIWATKSKSSKYTFNYKTMKFLNENKQMKSVWDISIVNGNERIKDFSGKKLHNTQKPEDLLKNIILASSKVGDTILDPFFGTGTTGVIAKKYLRNFIGIEKDENYVKHSKLRIDNVSPIEDDISKNVLDIKKKYLKINDLISMKILKSQYLYNKKGDKAFLKDNGKLKSGSEEFSIHQATKYFENGKYLNGWQYWYVKNNDGSFILIDNFRKENS